MAWSTAADRPAISLQRSAPAADAPIVAGFAPATGSRETVGKAAAGGVCCGGAAVLCSVLPAGGGAAAALAVVGALFGTVQFRRVRRRGGAGRGAAGAAAGIAILVCVGVLASQAAFASAGGPGPPAAPGLAGRADDPPYTKDGSVRIGAATLDRTTDGLTQFSVTFTVTNRSARTRSVDVDFYALGPRGNVITRDSAYVEGLAAGQSASSGVFHVVGPRLPRQLDRATFHVGQAVWYG